MTTLFATLAATFITALISTIIKVQLNVSDIWQSYIKHANNGLTPLSKIRKEKWFIISRYLINDTTQSVQNYKHGMIYFTNVYVMFRGRMYQQKILILLKFNNFMQEHYNKKLERLKHSEYKKNVKRVAKAIIELNKRDLELKSKQIENFWEIGWSTIKHTPRKQ